MARRHLAQWTLQPICALLAEEAQVSGAIPLPLTLCAPCKPVTLADARAALGIVQAPTTAKEAGLDPSKALALVDWNG